MKSTPHVLQIVGDPVGGIRKHVHALLLGFDNKEISQSYVFSNATTDKQFVEDLPLIKEKITGYIGPLYIPKNPSFRDILNIITLYRIVKTNSIDIVHGHGAKGGVYARILSIICGVVSIYTPHGGSVHKMFKPIQDIIYSTIEKILFSQTDFFLFESNYTAKSYFEKIKKDIHKYKDKMQVNYNGISPVEGINICYKDSVEKKYNIGVFAMLREQKGQKFAIEAIKMLVDDGYLVHLNLYGAGTDVDLLVGRVRELQIEDCVTFHGEVDDSVAYIKHMDIILIPSLFESFGYVAIEAFACCKPIIASRVGGLQEILDESSGLFVEPKNAEQISLAVKTYIDDPELITKHGQNGRQRFISYFTEENMIKGVLQTYRNLTGG